MALERLSILQKFSPFCHPENIRGMLIGNDLDALLSACLLKTQFGWDVVGFYDYQNLWCSPPQSVFIDNLLNGHYLAVDMDIYHPAIPSIGHHIITLSRNEKLPGQRLSLNPNLLRGISLQNFQAKYPLATIHLLLYLFDVKFSQNDSELLIWLADSTFINGQSHRFRSNVHDWLSNFLPSDYLLNTFAIIDTPSFEERLKDKILEPLQMAQLALPVGQITSRHLKLSGFQCQWHTFPDALPKINQLVEFIHAYTNWAKISLPRNLKCLPGKRQKMRLTNVFPKYPNLTAFLEAQQVFSFVFPFAGVINFTNGFPQMYQSLP